jgi:hypothetical protein
MFLKSESRIEVHLLYGCGSWTQRQVADEFDGHPERNPVTCSTVRKLLNFKENGSMADKPHAGELGDLEASGIAVEKVCNSSKESVTLYSVDTSSCSLTL